MIRYKKETRSCHAATIASQIAVAAPLLETGLIINSFKSFSAHFLLDYITKAEFEKFKLQTSKILYFMFELNIQIEHLKDKILILLGTSFGKTHLFFVIFFFLFGEGLDRSNLCNTFEVAQA